MVGAGLAGLVATAELANAGRRVVLLEQEPAPWLGEQADWMATAGFDREQDHWPRMWAKAYLAFAAGEKRSWLRSHGITFFPVVGWAERGGYGPAGPGNSAPPLHVAWGTGPGVVAPFERRVREAAARGVVRMMFRHRVDVLTPTGGVVDGVHGAVLEPSSVERGRPRRRQ